MAKMLLFVLLLIAAPALAQENPVDTLLINGDHIHNAEYDHVTEAYTVLGTEPAWVDLDAIGLERFHYQLNVEYDIPFDGGIQAVTLFYTLGDAGGVKPKNRTWDDVLPGKIFTFEHRYFYNVRITAIQRDPGVPIDGSSVSELKANF